MLKTRAGFTLAEVLVALTLTAVLGATLAGAFVSQARFFDKQEKVGAARSVARAGTNILLSELRMVEASGGAAVGILAATGTSITVRVPYALGLSCQLDTSNGKLKVSRLPVDSLVLATAGYSGYAYREVDPVTGGDYYVYVTSGGKPNSGTVGHCTSVGVTELPAAEGGAVIEIPGGLVLKTGTPVFLYQTVTYSFKASASVPGRLGLYRRLENAPSGVTPEEELAAPFSANAGFRFFDDFSSPAKTTVPAYPSITGIEVTLDGLTERPNSDGTHEVVEHVTAVYFKNR